LNLGQYDWSCRFRGPFRQPIRCSRDQLAGLGQALNAFRVMPNHNLLDNSLNDLHERLR
jgi:hypothetical protein